MPQFKRGQDPIKSLGLGYGNKQRTKAWRILEFIESKGEEGASYTEIQEFIWVEINGGSKEDFWKKDRRRYVYRSGSSRGEYKEPGLRSTRGYYSTNLSGTHGWNAIDKGNKGLLHTYCKKNPDTKKWVIDRMPNPGENIYSRNESFKLVPESLNEIMDI